MLKSMTGQGSSSASNESYSTTVEIRAVNNRHFKISIRIAESLNLMEPNIEKVVRETIHRGSISVNVRVDSLAGETGLFINKELMASYLEDLRIAMGDPTLTLQPDTLVALPGVITQREKDLELDEPLQSLILAAVSKASQQLHEMRTVEGVQLAMDLRGNLQSVRESLSAVEDRAPDVIEQYTQKITERVNRRLEQHKITLEDRDLIREIAIFADKCDISEEMVRLDSHLKQMEQLLDSDDHAGRKLDFMAQELLRETNTIGSKANDGDIAKLVVEMKSAIDRIKEQVQNIE